MSDFCSNKDELLFSALLFKLGEFVTDFSVSAYDSLDGAHRLRQRFWNYTFR